MSTTKNRWKKLLTHEQFHVCREGGTELPFSGKYVHQDERGMYHCVACGALLFSSDTKFDSGTGWPSFWDIEPRGQGPRGEIPSEATSDMASRMVTFHDDVSLGMNRTEVRCARCGSHLGHVFNDGPKEKTGLRYCINSVALEFKPKDDA